MKSMLKLRSLLAVASVVLTVPFFVVAGPKAPALDVVVYRSGECGAWRDAVATVRAAGRELGVRTRVRVVVVRSRTEAERIGFHGSPSVLVAGVDVEGPEVVERPSSFG